MKKDNIDLSLCMKIFKKTFASEIKAVKPSEKPMSNEEFVNELSKIFSNGNIKVDFEVTNEWFNGGIKTEIK